MPFILYGSIALYYSATYSSIIIALHPLAAPHVSSSCIKI